MKRKRSDRERTPWVRLAPKSEQILDRGWTLIQSVPYRVSLRWLFYRLLQEGFYKTKSDYKNTFTKLFGKARYTGFKEWRPDTLVDEGRAIISRAGGCAGKDEAKREMQRNILAAASVPVDHFYRQKNYAELWYEANAMSSRLEYYTRDIDLVPMGGSASIPYKWQIARRLEAAAWRYGKLIKILYFGDEDEAGHKIKETVEKDVRRWCAVDFDIIWCGLTEEQIEQYEVPENFEKHGYQWEALPDEAAREIITSAVERYIDRYLIEEAESKAKEFEDEWTSKLEAALNKESW